MSVNEFVFDLDAFENEMDEEGGGAEAIVKRGWSKNGGRYSCLVPDCLRRNTTFGQKFALSRHWADVHSPSITLYKCTKGTSCRTFKRPYDLERHLVKIHHIDVAQAKVSSSGEYLKTKIVTNKTYLSPGEFVGPKPKSVAGTNKPIMSESVPSQSVMDIDPKFVKVQITQEEDVNETDVEVHLEERDESKLPDVPEPHAGKVEGARLSTAEEDEKKQLVRDILLAKDKIKFWANKEKCAKDKLKKLEIKEQRLREKGLTEQLKGERSARRRMEEEIRKLKGQLVKGKSVLDDVDVFKYQEMVLGDCLNLGEE